MHSKDMERTFRKAVAAIVAVVVITVIFFTFRLLEKVRTTAETQTPGIGRVITYKDINTTVFEFDSCEYLETSTGVTHKGNCKYCAARAVNK